jgi:hypothetical protein
MPTGGERGAREAVSPLWLSHHFPEQYDRCVLIGSRHVCRRCLALYPLAFAVMFLSLAGVHWPGSWDGVLLVVLPLPAVVEFVAEQLGAVRYRPRRQVLVTIPLALALGRGFALYVDDPGSRLFWGIVVAYGGVCSAALALRFRREKHSV